MSTEPPPDAPAPPPRQAYCDRCGWIGPIDPKWDEHDELIHASCPGCAEYPLWVDSPRVRRLAIPRTQKLYLDLIAASRHDNFDGPQVAAWLKTHPTTWSAVLFLPQAPGLTLRDLPTGGVYPHTLYILTTAAHTAPLVATAQTEWGADTIRVLHGEPLARFLGAYLPRECEDDRRVVQVEWGN